MPAFPIASHTPPLPPNPRGSDGCTFRSVAILQTRHSNDLTFLQNKNVFVEIFLIGRLHRTFYIWLKNVSCEYNRRVVETHLCELSDTSDTFIGRACATSIFNLQYGVYELNLRYGCWYSAAQGWLFARVLHLFFMKYTPYRTATPLGATTTRSTRRSYKDDAIHNHCAHGYIIYIPHIGREDMHGIVTG